MTTDADQDIEQAAFEIHRGWSHMQVDIDTSRRHNTGAQRSLAHLGQCPSASQLGFVTAQFFREFGYQLRVNIGRILGARKPASDSPSWRSSRVNQGVSYINNTTAISLETC